MSLSNKIKDTLRAAGIVVPFLLPNAAQAINIPELYTGEEKQRVEAAQMRDVKEQTLVSITDDSVLLTGGHGPMVDPIYDIKSSDRDINLNTFVPNPGNGKVVVAEAHAGFFAMQSRYNSLASKGQLTTDELKNMWEVMNRNAATPQEFSPSFQPNDYINDANWNPTSGRPMVLDEDVGNMVLEAPEIRDQKKGLYTVTFRTFDADENGNPTGPAKAALNQIVRIHESALEEVAKIEPAEKGVPADSPGPVYRRNVIKHVINNVIVPNSGSILFGCNSNDAVTLGLEISSNRLSLAGEYITRHSSGINPATDLTTDPMQGGITGYSQVTPIPGKDSGERVSLGFDFGKDFTIGGAWSWMHREFSNDNETWAEQTDGVRVPNSYDRNIISQDTRTDQGPGVFVEKGIGKGSGLRVNADFIKNSLSGKTDPTVGASVNVPLTKFMNYLGGDRK